MAQHVEAQRLDVLGRDVGAALEEGVRLGRAEQKDRGARRGAELDQRRELAQPASAGRRVAATRSRTYSLIRSST